MMHAFVCSSGAFAAPRPAHGRLLERTGQAVLVLPGRQAPQSTPLCKGGVGLIRCCQTPAAHASSVKHNTINLNRRISSPAHALFRLGHRKDQSPVSTRAQGVQQSESDETHLQDAVAHVLSVRSELDSLMARQLSPACSVAIKKLEALCQSGHHEQVAAAFAQEGFLQEGIWQQGVFPTLVLWHHERMSSGGGPVSDLLLSLLQALPAHVASSLQLLPTDDVCLVDLPRHWQVLAMQPHRYKAAVFQDEVISSNVKVKTGAALMMLLSLIGSTDHLTRAAEAGVDTVVFEQMLQTINSWSALKDDASLERDKSQSSQTSGDSPFVRPQADCPEIAATLPFVAAARVLETLVYCHRMSPQQDEYASMHVPFNRAMVIASFALSSCSRKTTQKVEQPHEEDIYKTHYYRPPFPDSSEEDRETIMSWLEQCRTEFAIDTSRRAEVISMVDITPGQLLQLSSKLQKCQILSERWFTRTQGNAFKLFVEMLRDCVTMQPSPDQHLQHSQAETNASIRTFMPYLVDMLHHPSEHVRGYAARHMSYLHQFAEDVVASSVLNDSGGGLGSLLWHLANSKDFGDRASYASLVGICSLHCDAHMLEELNKAGTCQLVYSLLEQADSDSSKSQLLLSLELLASRSEDMAASIVSIDSVRLLTQMLQSALDETAHVELESGKREVLGRCLKLLGSVLKKVYTSSTDLQDDSDLIATAIGALLEVVQKPILLDCMSGLGHHALGCLYYLTSTTPAARRQALQLLTVDKIEDLLRAALTWLEDESQPEMHWAIAARLISSMTDIPEGRQVLAQRRMFGRVAKVFTSERSDYLQAVLLPVCATLSVLNQDGSYATIPWLTRQVSYLPPDEYVFDKAAPLQALSLHRAPLQPPVGQQRVTQQVQQVGQQAEQKVVQQSERQPVQPNPSQGVHELSPASNVTPVLFFHDVSEDPEEAKDDADGDDDDAAADDDDEESWWWSKFMKEKPGLAIPLEVQKKSGKAWHDVLVAAAVRLTASEEPSTRRTAMSWLARLEFTVTDEAGKELVQAGAGQASLQLLQRETDHEPSRLDAMQFCLRLHQRGLLPTKLLLEANVHQQLIDIYTKPDMCIALKTVAASLLCLMWQRQPSLVSQFVSQHPIASLPGLNARDYPGLAAFLPLLITAVLRGVLRYAEGLAFSEQLLQLTPWLLGTCHWLLDQHSNADDAFAAEVLSEALVQCMDLLCSMANSPLYLSAVRSSALAVVCARITGGPFNQAAAESHRAQQLIELVEELRHKLAQAGA